MLMPSVAPTGAHRVWTDRILRTSRRMEDAWAGAKPRFAHPAAWLFPGQDPMLPMTTRQFNRAVHAAAEILHDNLDENGASIKGFRISPSLLAMVDSECQSRHTHFSEFVRYALVATMKRGRYSAVAE